METTILLQGLYGGIYRDNGKEKLLRSILVYSCKYDIINATEKKRKSTVGA